MQYKRGCAVRMRHLFRANEHVQSEQDTSSVKMRISITSEAHLQNECGCAVPVTQRYVFTTNDDVKYEQGISSASSLGKGETTQRYFRMNHYSYQYIN